MSFGSLLFTPAVKALQERYGTVACMGAPSSFGSALSGGHTRQRPPVRVRCVNQDAMNARRSALIWSAFVTGMPCGKPG